MSKIMNNVVPKKTMREVQSKTLNELADILKLSFGPNGSNACFALAILAQLPVT